MAPADGRRGRDSGARRGPSRSTSARPPASSNRSRGARAPQHPARPSAPGARGPAGPGKPPGRHNRTLALAGVAVLVVAAIAVG
ncbi:MAG: hypothetical protein ACRDYD_02360, partial [Acidimicrobiales bacterium]